MTPSAEALLESFDASTGEDKLEIVRQKVAEVRDAELRLEDLEEQVSLLKKQLDRIYKEELPSLMDEAGVDSLGIPASGNHPAFDAKLSPFYSANIAASWDAERRAQGFRWLEENGHGDLIKTEVAVSFARGDHEEAKKLLHELSAKGVKPSLKESVHAQTLTAWLREQVESGGEIPPLEKIGGYIGRVVNLKPRKG